MKNLDDFTRSKRTLLAAYDRILESDLVPVQGIDASKIREKRTQLAEEHFIVAVCGQIKAGKSTLLNALLFGSPVLPQDVTVMTAKNTEIKRGESPGFEAHFYEPGEWQTLTDTLKRTPDAWNRFEAEVDKAVSFGIIPAEQIRPGGRVERREGFAELPKFVTPSHRGGVYSPFVKSIVVTYVHPWLDEVTMADTPGVNDSNPYRDRLTKDWIHKADAVVFVSYAGQALDEQDFQFIDRHLLHVDRRRRIIVINKMDVTDDPEGVRAWVDSLRNRKNDPRLGTVFGDKDCTEFVSALGGLIARMISTGVVLDADLDEWRERLAKQDWLAPHRHRVDHLRTLIETKLITNKGEALIQGHQRFLESVFYLNTRDLVAKAEERKGEIELLTKDVAELQRQHDAIGGQIAATARLMEQFQVRLKSRLNTEYGRLNDILLHVRNTIFEEAMSQITTIANTSHFAPQVCWTVVRQFELKRATISEALENATRATEAVFNDAVKDLKGTLGKDDFFSFGAIDALIDISSYSIVAHVRDSILGALNADVVDDLVDDSTSFIQRWFDTSGGIKNILAALFAALQTCLENTFTKTLSRGMVETIGEQVDKTRNAFQTAVTDALEKKRTFLAGVLGNLKAREADRAKANCDLVALAQRQGEVETLRREILGHGRDAA
jgi:hypothetical protein